MSLPASASSPSSPKSISHSQLPKQQSSLPRLHPPARHSPSRASVTTANVASPEDESERTTTSMSTARNSSESFRVQTPMTTPSHRQTPAPPSPLSLFTAPSSSSSTSTTDLPSSVPSISARRNVTAPQPRVFTRFPSATGTAAVPNRNPL